MYDVTTPTDYAEVYRVSSKITNIKVMYWLAPKIGTIFLYTLILSDTNRFLKLFYCQNHEKICNNSIAIDPTSLNKCVATLPCEMSMSGVNCCSIS